jgi:hypothetical protein
MNPFMLKIDQSMHSMDFKTQNLHQKACEEMVAIKILVSLSDFHSHLILAQRG